MVDITSPCVRNCCLNEEDICLGCFRSLDEILQWSNATDERKEEVLQLTVVRKAEHQLKYESYKKLGNDSDENQ